MNILERKLILGTALWGWVINKQEAFLLLDNFVKLGGRYIDCATNYPINKNLNDYGLALKWLEEWIGNNNIKLYILVKIGSIDNLGSSVYDISKERIKIVSQELIDRFQDSLWCISVHWDNRTEETDFDKVHGTVGAFKEIKDKGILIGLSGIKNPALYYEVIPELSDDWIIQCKENLLTSEARLSYQEVFPLSEYYAYGINMGGLKLSSKEEIISSKIREINYSSKLINLISNSLNSSLLKDNGIYSVNDLNTAFIFVNNMYSGLITGSRTTEQLSSTFKTWNKLEKLNSDTIILLKEYIDKLKQKVRNLD